KVNVYTDLSVATAKLDKEIAASPDDPDPRLRYADVMFVSNNIPAALARLDEAIALVGGRTSMRPGAGRDRIFNSAMTFAQKLSDPTDKNSAETVATITEFFSRAAQAASSPIQQVNYRIARARFAQRTLEY